MVSSIALTRMEIAGLTIELEEWGIFAMSQVTMVKSDVIFLKNV